VIVTGCIAVPPVFVHVSVYVVFAVIWIDRVTGLVTVPMP